MNDSITEDASAATAAGQRKDKAALKELSQDELLKQAERYFGLLQIAKKKYSELNVKCSSIEEERDGAFIVLAKLKSANSVASIEELQNKINLLEQNAVHYEEHIRTTDEKVSEMEHLQRKLQEVRQEKESILRKYNDLQEESQCRKMQIQTLTVTYQSVEESMKALNAKNKELSDENQVLIEARDSIMTALKSVKDELSTAKARSEVQSQEMDSLKEQKQMLEKKLVSNQEDKEHIFNEEIESILRLLPQAEMKILQPDSPAGFDSKYQELNDFSFRLMSEFANVGFQCKDFENSLASVTTKYEELIKENEVMKKEMANLTKDEENLEMQNLEKRLLEATANNVSLIDNKSKHLLEIETLKSEVLTVTENLKDALNEKDNIISALKDVYNNLALEHENQNDTPIDIISTLSANYNIMADKVLEASANNVSLIDDKSKHLLEIETLKTEVLTITDNLKDALNEKDNIISALKDVYNNLALEHENQNDTPIDIISTLSANYNSMADKVRMLEEDEAKAKLEDMQQKCKDYEKQIVTLSEKLDIQLKQIADLQRLTTDDAGWESKFDSANAEKDLLRIDNSSLIEKQKRALKEIENLKQQLDEYENDIQKHQNLEQENISLNEMLEEVEAKNYKLNELHENKCTELGDVVCNLNALMEGLRFKLGRSDSFANDALEKVVINEKVFILQSLFDDLCSELSSGEENIASIVNQLENSEKEKICFVNELRQIQDLKQFLEYENQELREEILQMKSEMNTRPSESNATEQNEIKVMNDADTQVAVGGIDVAIEAGQFIETTILPQNVHLQNSTDIGMVSEWGYVGGDSPNCEDSSNVNLISNSLEESRLSLLVKTESGVSKSSKLLNDVSVQVDVEMKDVTIETELFILPTSPPQHLQSQNCTDIGIVSEWGYGGGEESEDPSNDATINNLQEENKRLSSLLETKSGLTEKIHCEVDHLLSKVEELTVEIHEKESDLKAAKVRNVNLEKEIKDLKNTILLLQHTANNSMNEARVIKDSIEKSHKDFEKHFKAVSDSVEATIEHIQAKYTDCYAMLAKYKFKNLDLEDRKLHLVRNCSHFAETIIGLLDSAIQKCDRLQSDDSIPISSIVRTFDVEDSNFTNEFSTNIDLLKNILQLILDQDHEKNQDLVKITCENVSEVSTDNVIELNVCSSCEQLQNQLSESEIKVNKLKAVAIKIKKELKESTRKCDILKEEKEKMSFEIAELSEEINHMTSEHRQYVQNYQNLQCEYDKAQDENEKVKAENKTFQNDLASTLIECNNLKQSLSEKESEMKKQNDAFDSTEKEKSALKAKISDADSKLIISESKYQDYQMKIQELTNEIQKLQKQISELEKDKKELAGKVEEALMETKQHSLMDLEMADYERTISDLTEQAQKKVSEVLELTGELETCKTRIQGQEDQIKFCENHRITEEKRAEGFKSALEDSKKELAILRDCESSLRNQLTEFTSKVKVLTLQEGDYKTQLSQLSGEVEKMKEMLRSSDESHQRIVQSLNAKITTQKQEILLAHNEVETVKQDFENYKVRVHTVLKQQKTTPPFTSDDVEIKEKLEAQNEKLKLQLKDVSEKLQAYKLESETQLEEHDHLLQRHSKVVEELEAKDRYWNQKLEQIMEERNKLQDLIETMASEQSLKNEMLASTYKKQVKLIQEENKHIIQGLQKQLESADVEISRLQRDQQKNIVSSPASATGQDEIFNAFDISSQERQECEGSECTEDGSTPIRSLSLATIPTSGFLPLEKLLQSPPEPHTPTSTISNRDSEKLNLELNSSWKKIDHLSELLNESEASNLRLSEQVRVLKEEIRRQERNKQREEHTKNMEYLKNVFIKFATLESGSEKARLVPVLNTILKLSPDEAKQLKDVAGDIDPAAAAAASNEGWGNYLHRWSGMM